MVDETKERRADDSVRAKLEDEEKKTKQILFVLK